MTDQAAQTAETSDNAPQAPRRKGNQLEGPKAGTLNTKDAADIFKGSILGETADKGDNSSGDDNSPVKTAKQKQPKNPDEGQSEADEADEILEDEEADLDDEDEEGQSEDDEETVDEDGAAEDELDEGEYEADDDEDLHTVIVDGEEVQIPYSELVDGYQRQADYSKKTEELARERKALTAEKEQIADLPRVKEAYQTEAGRFAQNAELVLVALEKGFMPQPPDEGLRESDPNAYLLQKEKHQEAIQFMQGLQGEMVRIKQQAEKETANAVNEGRVKLLQAQPELQKPEIRGKLQSYIKGLGYTEDQMKREADHRLFELAFKAMKWDDMIERSKKPAPEKKRPKVLKNRKAREDKASIAHKKKSDALNRHKRDHSIKSASDVIAHRIKNSRRK
jgi:hypothetical protein